MDLFNLRALRREQRANDQLIRLLDMRDAECKRLQRRIEEQDQRWKDVVDDTVRRAVPNTAIQTMLEFADCLTREANMSMHMHPQYTEALHHAATTARRAAEEMEYQYPDSVIG